MTNFTKVGVFSGILVQLVITDFPTQYFPPLSTEQPISAPQPQPEAMHSGLCLNNPPPPLLYSKAVWIPRIFMDPFWFLCVYRCALHTHKSTHSLFFHPHLKQMSLGVFPRGYLREGAWMDERDASAPCLWGKGLLLEMHDGFLLWWSLSRGCVRRTNQSQSPCSHITCWVVRGDDPD